MSDLVATKLVVPRIDRELVDRPTLIAALDAGSTTKLTLVCAPVGYGKTTLVSDWLSKRRTAAAWLSLESSDNQIARYLNYLICALQQIDPTIGTAIPALSEGDIGAPKAIEDLLSILVNDIAASNQKFTLVLDNYHVISTMRIHRVLEFLLDHMPPGMNVILISRADPPVPLGRLRVLRQLTELREADLRFSVEEIGVFFNVLMGCDLSGEEITNLEVRTEGWIGGLQLVALTLQRCQDSHEQVVSITGSHRHLIDYLVDEVMSQQTEEMRSFLLCTSILKRFNASLCCVLMQNPSGQEMLRNLEKDRLFLVSLDDECNWYRYHHLFADFLRRRLIETRPETVSELYQRVSHWYETHGMLDKAGKYAKAVHFSHGSESSAEGNLVNQPTREKDDEFIEPLSEREIQVLRLLAARLTYKEIAYELCLSINTIKWYTKNVYGKLGVDRRDKAAVRARELSIL